jgi:hypothetical protein
MIPTTITIVDPTTITTVISTGTIISTTTVVLNNTSFVLSTSTVVTTSIIHPTDTCHRQCNHHNCDKVHRKPQPQCFGRFCREESFNGFSKKEMNEMGNEARKNRKISQELNDKAKLNGKELSPLEKYFILDKHKAQHLVAQQTCSVTLSGLAVVTSLGAASVASAACSLLGPNFVPADINNLNLDAAFSLMASCGLLLGAYIHGFNNQGSSGCIYLQAILEGLEGVHIANNILSGILGCNQSLGFLCQSSPQIITSSSGIIVPQETIITSTSTTTTMISASTLTISSLTVTATTITITNIISISVTRSITVTNTVTSSTTSNVTTSTTTSVSGTITQNIISTSIITQAIFISSTQTATSVIFTTSTTRVTVTSILLK